MSASAGVRALPQTMRAVRVQGGKGPASALYFDDAAPVPALDAGSDALLVRVHAFGLNRMDLLQREGQYPVPPGASDIMGVEYSGTVVSSASDRFREGQAVFGLTTGGCYAQYVVAQARMALPKPAHLSHAQAASVPEAWFTAFQALRLLADLQRGEDVLIHAGASGVGLAAIQLARDMGARKVFVTAGSADKIEFCQSLGADAGINYKEDGGDWASALRELTQGQGVDVIMDFLGASYFRANLDSLKRDGRLTMQGFMGGTQLAEPGFDLSAILGKRLTIRGSTLRSRSLEYQAALVQAFEREGALDKCVHETQAQHKLVVHRVYPWTDVRQAHDDMAANKNTGKLVLSIID